MLSVSLLSRRLAALPLDRAPLRRAALLTVLLAVLLLATRWIAPARPRPATEAARQFAPASTETLSARPPARRGGGWGQAVALLLLAGGGGLALRLRTRTVAGAPRAASSLDVLESHTLAPGQSLRLVACGSEVLLLSLGSDGTRLLRHWPRDRFDREVGGAETWDALAATASCSPDSPEPSGGGAAADLADPVTFADTLAQAASAPAASTAAEKVLEAAPAADPGPDSAPRPDLPAPSGAPAQPASPPAPLAPVPARKPAVASQFAALGAPSFSALRQFGGGHA